MARHLIAHRNESHCEIDVEPGVLTKSGLAARVIVGEPDRIVVLHQPGSRSVAQGVADGLDGSAATVTPIELPDGEAAKSFSTVEDICLQLNDLGTSRHDLVIGVGGGALTDVAGYIAASYLRGITAVMVPTTLLGAVDASIGGKTGINVGGKNLAGAFRHPRRVVIDPDMLRTLPEPLLRQGSAEALKAGFIADEALVELYERHGLDADLDEVVERAVAVKVGVVNGDFTELGARAWLNYGHTVGHAVEVAGGLSHGESVAVGMVAAAEASKRLVGFDASDRQRQAIERLGLPTRIDDVPRVEALRLMALDKKRDHTGLRMTLLRSVGDPVVAPVDDATVDAALAAVGIS